MADSKPVVVRLASGVEYGLKNAATAARIYPNGTIVRYQDGTPYDAEAHQVAVADMKRADLNAYAAKLGIEDADQLPNRDAVIAAIEGHDDGTD